MTMLIKQRRSWELPESAATSESVYMSRREWLKAAGCAEIRQWVRLIPKIARSFVIYFHTGRRRPVRKR